MSEQNGKAIQCVTCAGAGIVMHRPVYDPQIEECPDCGGSGLNWEYAKGAIARFYGGPLIGRMNPAASPPTPTTGRS